MGTDIRRLVDAMTMTRPVLIIRGVIDNNMQPIERSAWVWCPGCNMVHRFILPLEGGTVQGKQWDWDGNLEAPTFNPSLLCYSCVDMCPTDHKHIVACEVVNCEVRSHAVISESPLVLGHHNGHVAEQGNCHSFVRNGQWEFLSDSAHTLAGQTVPMVPLPDWLF